MLSLYRLIIGVVIFASCTYTVRGQEGMNQIITLEVENKPLDDVLWQLSELIDVPMSFSSRDIQDELISANFISKSLEHVLNEVLSGTNNYFNFINGQLYILKNPLDNFTLSGYIEDANTGERLIGATVYNLPSYIGSATNNFGFFSLKGDVRDTSAVITYIGYKPYEVDFRTISGSSQIIKLMPDNDLPEITISGENLVQSKLVLKSNKNLIKVHDLAKVSSVGGEFDIMRLIYQLPGATTGTDGLGGLHVRGGNADQNLIKLDGVQIYNPYHSFGLFSIFDNNTMSSVNYLKGAFPARFGGRLSSVLDVRLKDGNNKSFASKLSVGLLATRAMIEGPIVEDKLSFMINVRHTHFDPIFKKDSWRERLLGPGDSELGYLFGDVVSKVTYTPTANDRIYLSYYGGNDSYNKSTTEIDSFLFDTQVKDSQVFDWGNKLFVTRWNHQCNKNLFSNITLNYSKFNFISEERSEYILGELISLSEDTLVVSSNYNSNIEKFTAKIDLEYLPNSNHFLRGGITYADNRYKPGISVVRGIQTDMPIEGTPLNSKEVNAYIEDEWQVNSALSANFGVFSSIFKTDNNTYYSIEPRLALIWKPTPKMMLGASANRVSQNLHVLSREGAGFPTDLWVPSTDIVKPQSAFIADVSMDYMFPNIAEVSLSSYYKKMNNIISYREVLEFGTLGSGSLLTSDNWQQNVTPGEGFAKGFEVSIQRNKTDYSLNISYSLSDSDRKFDLVNGGEKYPFTFEHRHKLSINYSKVMTKRWRADLSWNYNSGSFVNIPISKWQYIRQNGRPDYFYYDIGEKNSFRLPAYHRFDFAFTYAKPTAYGEFKLVFGVYNLYNRKNTYTINAEFLANETKLIYNNVSIIPILPYFNMQFSIFKK